MEPIVLIPAAGKSSRFYGKSPKWMRTHPDGSLMIEKAIETFKGKKFEIFLITTEEIDNDFDVVEKLNMALPDLNIVLLKDPTSSSVETLFKGLEKIAEKLDFNRPMFVKDVDNVVEFDWEKFDFSYSSSVAVDLKSFHVSNVSNKSFILNNENDIIIDFIEKQIVSNFISVGTHYFKNVLEALRTAQILLNLENQKNNEAYISHLIAYNIFSGIEYKMILASKYEDYGTQVEWDLVRDRYKTLFVDFDGTLVQNRGKYGSQNWFTRNDIPLVSNLEIIKNLFFKGSQIIITTSRPDSEKEYISNFLSSWDIIPFNIICGLNHSERIVINDFYDTNRYPTASAINLPRNGDLSMYLKNSI
jgi:hypothetical protein